jgi:hypothetical protein
MWAGPPLSFLDPDLSRQYFQQVMDKLDANGIVLAGLELESEINMAGNNPDFRLPGEGKALNRSPWAKGSSPCACSLVQINEAKERPPVIKAIAVGDIIAFASFSIVIFMDVAVGSPIIQKQIE